MPRRSERPHVEWVTPFRLLKNGRGPLVLGVMSDAKPAVKRLAHEAL